MIVNGNRNNFEAYIEDVYPMEVAHSTNACNVRLTTNYDNVRESCGRNPNNLPINHLERNFTRMLKFDF